MTHVPRRYGDTKLSRCANASVGITGRAPSQDVEQACGVSTRNAAPINDTGFSLGRVKVSAMCPQMRACIGACALQSATPKGPILNRLALRQDGR
jgi:hypothetical protein